MVSRNVTLNVWMNGILVGELTKSSSGALTFIYVKDWLETNGARPVSLSLPLQHKPYSGEAVYNYFDNLLPDNKQIRDRIQARFKVVTSHPFDLLSIIGRDCVGAIQLVPKGKSPGNIRQIKGVPLDSSQVAHILNNYRTTPLGMVNEEDDDFRISIAGAQEKTALLRKDGQWHRPTGATPTTHIFKIPIGKIEYSGMDLSESCENEWICLKIAEAFGLPVCHAEIENFTGPDTETKALVVERFDRRQDDGWLIRLPQEDMCQALGFSPSIKYECDGGPGIVPIMRFLLQSRDSKTDRELFFKSQVLFWLLAAIDGHAKNFSIFIEPMGRFKMTPLYDIMSAYPLLENKSLHEKKIKMAMALISKNRHYHWYKMQPRHFISTAKHVGFNIKTAKSIFLNMMDSLDDVVQKVQGQIPANFHEQVANFIIDGMLKQRERYSDSKLQ